MRCVACDRPLKVSESPWLPEQGRFEDMCRACRSTIAPIDDDVGNAELLAAHDDPLTDVPEGEY